MGRILVVCGRDETSIFALRRAASFGRMLRTGIRALFLMPDGTPPARLPEMSSFVRFAEHTAGLRLTEADVEVAAAAELGERMLRDAAPALVICPADGDCSSETGSLSPRGLWARTARLGAPLLVTRRDVYPKHVVVASDGTRRTLPALEHAFALSGHEQSPLSYVDTMRIPWMFPRDVWPSEEARPLLRLSEGDGVGTLARSATRSRGAPIGALPRIAKVCARLRADTLVVGASSQEAHLAEELIESLSCSVLVVPTASL